MTKQSYRTGDLAELFGVHQNTIRSYVDKLESHLSEDATAARRKYTEHDARIIYTVVNMRDIGISFDDIAVAISEGRIEEHLPEQPTPEDEQARDSVELVTIPRDRYLLEQEELIKQIALITQERDNLLARLETSDNERDNLQQRVTDLEGDLKAATAKLESERQAAKDRIEIIQQERKPSEYWLRILAGTLLTVILLAALVVWFILQNTV